MSTMFSNQFNNYTAIMLNSLIIIIKNMDEKNPKHHAFNPKTGNVEMIELNHLVYNRRKFRIVKI